MQDAVFPLRLLAWWTIILPPVALVLCVFWSLLMYYDKVVLIVMAITHSQLPLPPQATYTHCEMTEVLPSISAVIGGFEWQRFIWTFSVAITTGPRLAFCYLQRANLREKFNSKLGAIRLNFFLNCVEIVSLLTLSLGKDLEK